MEWEQVVDHPVYGTRWWRRLSDQDRVRRTMNVGLIIVVREYDIEFKHVDPDQAEKAEVTDVLMMKDCSQGLLVQETSTMFGMQATVVKMSQQEAVGMIASYGEDAADMVCKMVSEPVPMEEAHLPPHLRKSNAAKAKMGKAIMESML